jgi:hypothetical protein
VRVPVGVVVLEEEPEATEIVMVSLAPELGVVVAADRVVVDATCDDDEEEPTVTAMLTVEAA